MPSNHFHRFHCSCFRFWVLATFLATWRHFRRQNINARKIDFHVPMTNVGDLLEPAWLSIPVSTNEIIHKSSYWGYDLSVSVQFDKCLVCEAPLPVWGSLYVCLKRCLLPIPSYFTVFICGVYRKYPLRLFLICFALNTTEIVFSVPGISVFNGCFS